MTDRLRVFSIILLLSFVSPALADESISLKQGYLMLKPSGQFAADAATAGTRVDMATDMGLGQSNGSITELAVQLEDSRFSVAYLPIRLDGAGILNRNVNFNGTVYAANATINSSMQLDMIDLAYTYFLLNMDDLPSRTQLGVQASLKIVQAELALANVTTGASQSVSQTVPIPTIGLYGRVALADFLGLNGRVQYISVAGNRLLDADVQIEFSPMPMAGIYGGYRQMDIKLSASGLYADAKLSGPYFGAMVRF